MQTDALRIYFGGSQDHFNLKNLLSRLALPSHKSQLYIISVHSDANSHGLPTWHSDMVGSNSVYESIVTSIVTEDSSNVEIHHLDLLKSEASLRHTIDSWTLNEDVGCYILIVDMQLRSSSNLVNFVRSYIEQKNLSPTKRFLILLHYPLSVGKSSYPALFLGRWECIYLDGIGYRDASSSILSVINVFEAACFNQQLNASTLIEALLPKAIQYASSQCRFYSSSIYPDSVNHKMEFITRHKKVEAILAREFTGKSLGMLLGEKYISLWTNEGEFVVIFCPSRFASTFALLICCADLGFHDYQL